MKKFFACVTALITVFTLFGCNRNKELTADELYSAIEKTASLQSLDMSYEIDMKLIEAGEYVDTPAEGSMKKAVVDGETVKQYGLTVDFGITKSETVIYVVGDTAYMDVLGEKTSLPAEAALPSVPVFELSQIKKEDMVSIASADDEGDTYSAEFAEGALDPVFDMILGSEAGELSYKNERVSFTVNGEGYVTVCRVYFEAESTDTEASYGAVADCTFTYNSPGTAVTVTLPDLGEYAEK